MTKTARVLWYIAQVLFLNHLTKVAPQGCKAFVNVWRAS